MFCQKCGNEISEETVFCPKCGNKVGGGNAVTKESAKEDKEKGSKKAKFIVIGLVVAALIGIFIKCIGGIAGNSILHRYKECPDMEVVATAVNDGDGYFVVKNTGDRVVKDFTVAYVGYDNSGNVINLGNDTVYKTFTCESANILSGETYGLGKSTYLNREVRYIDATISSVTYKDGEEWKTEGLDAWAKDISSEFSVEEYKKKIENMKTAAALAERNPYLEIVFSEKYDDNKYSNSDDLDLVVKNIGDKAVKTFNVILLEYDGNGYGVNVRFEYVVHSSNIVTVGSANLNPGDKNGWNWSLVFEPECKTFKTLINEIEFMDGTTWKNENALQWMLYNEDER